MIPAKTIQEITDATRIEEVVEDFVSLRRRGTNLIGLCPFHSEKTPSFNVNPVKGIFKCFGCGKAGDAITFLREHERFSYIEALKWLARKYNIEVKEEERTPEQIVEQQRTDALYIVNEWAQRHYAEQLFDTDEGRSVALSYFKNRGLREETIRTFGLGYAHDQRDALVKRARTEGYSVDLLREVGLCSQDGSRDFFRARVIFPIHNLSGKIAGFAGRTLSADKTVPKYINSPETEIYVKNKSLYGAFQARKAIRQYDECILVEGYMDVISMHQAGIENAVASSGTSLTEGQLQLIRRNASKLKILYDGDPAGVRAALRGLDLALEQDLDVRLVLLPPGEDPDSFVQQKGDAALRDYLDQEAQDFILFKTRILLEDTQGDPLRKAAVIKDIVGSIARVPDPIKRSVYLKECARLLDVDETALLEESNKLITQAVKKKAERDARLPNAATDAPDPEADVPTADGILPEKNPNRTLSRSDEFQERDLIRLLVQFGERMLEKEQATVAEYILADIEESFDYFDNPLYGRIARDCHAHLSAGYSLQQAYFLHHPDAEVQNLALEVLASPWELSPNWEDMLHMPLQTQKMPDDNVEEDTRRSLHLFKLRKVEKMVRLNQQRIKDAETRHDSEAAQHYLMVHLKLKNSLLALSKITGTVVLPKL